MKGVATLIIVFFYIYPIYLKMIPIPLDRIYQLLGVIVLLFNLQDFNKIRKSIYISKYLRLSFALLVFAVLVQLHTLSHVDLYFIKRIINIFLEFFSAYFVFWFVRQFNNKVNFGTILYYIVIAAIIQTFISITFFVKPDYYQIYYSYLNQEVENKEFEDMFRMLKVRLLGVGSSFFGGIVKYGVAFFSILILPFVYNNLFTKNKFIYWASVLIIFSGGLLTARSFIIAIMLGLLMVSIIKSKTIVSFFLTNIRIVLLSIPLLYVLYIIFSLIFEVDQFDKVFNYAFEIFVNYSKGDGLTSSSTEVLKDMYVWPDNITTWLIGDGRMQSLEGGYYKGTDVGYLRLIYYFGLPITLFFIFLLFKYYKILYKVANIRYLKPFFLIIFLWFFVLNFKGLAFHTYYYPLFLLFFVLPNKSIKNNT